MRTIELKIYKFEELSEEAQERAIKDHQELEMYGGYAWSSHTLASLKAGIEHFDAEMSDYTIDWLNPGHSKYKFSGIEEDTYEAWDNGIDTDGEEYVNEYNAWIAEKVEAMGTYNPETKKGNGDCKFTGYCMDESFGNGVRESYFKGERDLKELLTAGTEELLQSARKDFEWQLSEEAAKRVLIETEVEFTADGKLYH